MFFVDLNNVKIDQGSQMGLDNCHASLSVHQCKVGSPVELSLVSNLTFTDVGMIDARMVMELPQIG